MSFAECISSLWLVFSLKEGHEPAVEEAELLVSLSSVVAVYLAKKAGIQ